MSGVSPLQHLFNDTDLVREAIANSVSYSAALRQMGVRRSSKRISLLQEQVEEHGISVAHFRGVYAWSDEVIKSAVVQSSTYREVLNYLGVKGGGGGAHTQLRKRITDLGLSTSHFPGRSWSKGKPNFRRKTPEQIMVKQEEGSCKTSSKLLFRALLESGAPEHCVECGQGSSWKGKPLKLQIDHINGDRFDHRRSNLRILCPNCHTQTPTYGNKKR